MQATITGASAQQRVTARLIRPAGFHSVFTSAEHVPRDGRIRGGERLIVIADDVRLAIMLHAESDSVRVALSKVGRLRYNPLL